MNSIVYFRPRFNAAMNKRKKRREQASSSPKEEEQSSSRLAGSSAFQWSMGHLIARMGGSSRSPSGQSSAQLSKDKEMSLEEVDSVGMGDEDDTNFEPSAFIADERCYSGDEGYNHDDAIQLPRVPEAVSSCDPEEAKVEVEDVMADSKLRSGAECSQPPKAISSEPVYGMGGDANFEQSVFIADDRCDAGDEEDIVDNHAGVHLPSVPAVAPCDAIEEEAKAEIEE